MSEALPVDRGDPRRWDANPGPQSRFLASSAYEALYGGAAGGGKSDALLMGALRFVDRPGYRALLLRRTFPELARSLIERARRWYSLVGAHGSDGGKIWRFPSGAVIEFGHVEHDEDVYKYQSAEYQFLGFDELTHFTQHQYTYLLSRVRSVSGIPVRVRAGTNPGGEGHEWVKRRWGAWLDESHAGPRAESGEARYYRLSEAGDEVPCERAPGALSRVFVQARISDNPQLMAADPSYADRLRGLSVVERKRLLDGEWKLFEDPGALWRRSWFTDGRRSSAGELRRVVVAVDPAGSAKKTADEAGIVVAGIGPCSCLGKPDLHLFVLADATGKYAPRTMAELAIELYWKFGADRIVAEDNFGGQIVKDLITLVAQDPEYVARMRAQLGDRVGSVVAYKAVHASRGKAIRAEPVAATYHQGRAHHVGTFLELEDQLCTWNPITSSDSPGRLDALVWAGTDLMLTNPVTLGDGDVVAGERRGAEPVADGDDDGEEDEGDWS